MFDHKIVPAHEPFDPEARVTGGLFNLTLRERQTVKLVAQGLPNKLVADRLGCSFHTAKFHIKNVMLKLGADNRAQIAAIAVRTGLA